MPDAHQDGNQRDRQSQHSETSPDPPKRQFVGPVGVLWLVNATRFVQDEFRSCCPYLHDFCGANDDAGRARCSRHHALEGSRRPAVL